MEKVEKRKLRGDTFPATRCKAWIRLRILQDTQPAKNRKLGRSRLLSNLSRLNWSGERNYVYCFSTVFTLLQQQEVLFYPISSLFIFLVQQYVSDLYLSVANWPATLFFFSRISTPAYPAYSAFIRHCPFHYHILNDIKDHSTSSRNWNKGNRGNAPQFSVSPSHYFLSDLMENTTSKSLLGYY
jgi:hypothetical protein